MKYKHVQIGEIIPADALIKTRTGDWRRYYHFIGVTENRLNINYAIDPKNIKYPVKE